MGMQNNRNIKPSLHDVTPIKKPIIAPKKPVKADVIMITWLPLFLRKIVKMIKKFLHRIPRKMITTGLIVVIAMISAVLVDHFRPQSSRSIVDTSSPSITSVPLVLTIGTPDYDTILPTGRTIQDFGGWTRVSPPQSNPVFAYVDKINTSPITVSQQPLPKDFQTETTDQMEFLAQSYNANQKVTAGDTIIYIGTSAKGPQSIIFTKDKLLILIKSTVPISNDQWATYINSLQ